MANLNAQNNSICSIANQRLETKDQILQKQIDLIRNSLKLFEVNEGFRNTVPAVAYLQVEEAKKQRDELQISHSEVLRNYEALRTQKVVADQDKQQVENELHQVRRNINLKRDQQKGFINQNLALKNEKLRLKQDYEYNVNEADRLRRRIGEANDKALRIVDLEKEVQRLKEVQKRKPDAQKLQAEVGPIAPKYIPRKEDGPLEGAMDYKEEANAEGLEPEGRPADPLWVEYAKAYQNRYVQLPGPFGQVQKLRTAPQIAKAGFDYAFRELMKLEYRDKIKINQSEQTHTTPGRSNDIIALWLSTLSKGGKSLKTVVMALFLELTKMWRCIPPNRKKSCNTKKMQQANGSRKSF